MLSSVSSSLIPAPLRPAFVEARSALCIDDVATAKPLLEKIADELPENIDVKIHLAWASAQLKGAAITADDRKELEGLALEALQSRRALALPLCILGHAALQRGELRLARRLFRRSVDADPALLDAQRGARLAERRLARIDERKSSFSGLVGRWMDSLAEQRVAFAVFIVVTIIAALAHPT